MSQPKQWLDWLSGIQAKTGMTSNAIEAAVKRGDLDPATATADDVWRAYTGRSMPGPAKEYTPPQRASEAAPPEPTTEQRIANNPDVAAQIEANLPALSQIDPQLATRLQQRDPEAIFEAYQMIVGANGQLAPRPATRQMELPLGGDVPTTFSADVIGPTPSGPTFVTTGRRRPPAAPESGFANYGRMLEDEGGRLSGEIDSLLSRLSEIGGQLPRRSPAVQPAQPFGLARRLRRASQDFVAGLPAGRPMEFGGASSSSPQRSTLRDVAASGAAGAGGLLVGDRIGQEFMRDDGLAEPSVQAAAAPDMPLAPDDSVDLQSGRAADLAAETSPPPVVATLAPEEQAFVDSFKDGYRKREARMAAKRANAWRRPIDEGYVPLGDATEAEISRAYQRENNLVDMGVPRSEARERTRQQLAEEVVRRARARAEAFLQANPNF